MSEHLQALLLLLLLFVAWLGVPLLPAWVTYLITPNQRLGLTGPLEQLTVRASGAFAAYVVLLLLTYGLIVKGGLSIIGGMTSASVWTFEADVVAIDEAGQTIPIPETAKELDIAFKPNPHQLGKSKVRVRIPANPDNWPFLTVTVPDFGGAEVDLKKVSSSEINTFKKSIELEAPILVRRAVGGGVGIKSVTLSASPP